MEISANVGIKIKDDNIYDMGLKIPTGNISAENPFVFAVSNKTTKNGQELIDPVLYFAYGSGDNVYIAVKPPEKMLEGTKIEQYLDELEVVVKEGDFDIASKKFIEDKGDDEAE